MPPPSVRAARLVRVRSDHGLTVCRSRGSGGLAGAAAVLLLALLSLAPASALALQDAGPDVQVTKTGSLATISETSFNADVAYNSVRNEYLSVFVSRPGAPLATGEIEIFGRRLDAAGQPIGSAFRISSLGADGDADAVPADPAVAYSPASDSYLVVFSGDGGEPPYADDKHQIWSRLVAGDGTVAGPVTSAISSIGANADATDDALHPNVAWSTIADAFLVVFDVPILPAGHPANKIYSHRVGPDGTEIGADIFVSDTEPLTGADSATGYPGVGVNTIDGTWMVAWTAEPAPGVNAYDELEVFGRRISTAGARLDSDFRISQTGPESDGNANAWAEAPAVAFDPSSAEFLVAWVGDKAYPGAADGEFEVLAQRVVAAGVREQGTIRVSEVGPEGSSAGQISGFDLTFNAATKEFIALWAGDPATVQLVNDEFEIYGQRLATRGMPLGTDFRVGQTGDDGDAASRAGRPALVAGPGGQYLGVWDGRPAGLKTEIYADRLFTPIVSIADAAGVEGGGATRVPADARLP